MRQAIDTVSRNGDFIILEDEVSGTYAVARWSAEAEQWLDEEGKPSRLNATHWQPLASAPPVAPTDELGSFAGPIKSSGPSGGREASHSASGVAAQPKRAARRGRALPAWAGFAWRGCATILSAFAAAGGWAVRGHRHVATMAACLVIGVVLAPFFYRSDFGQWLLQRAGAERDSGVKLALRLEQERAGKLAGDVAAAQREAERQTALIHLAGEAASREKAASERALADLRQALQLERDDVTRAIRAEEEKERLIGELSQALKQQEDEAEQAKQASAQVAEALNQERDSTGKLGVELANAQRAGEAQAALLRSANDEAARIKEASARAADELRRALQQAQDKAEKLAADLAAARTAGDEARQAAETSKRSAEERSQALREAEGKAEKLGAELAATHREIEAQNGAAGAVGDEARRTIETGKRSADEQDQALREARARSEQLGAELAAARREIQSQVAVAGAAREQAADEKEAAGRSADEQRRALQQEREKAGKLAAELAEARSSLAAQAQAKAAEEAARDRTLAAMSEELQKAQAEATLAREALEVARARSEPPTALPVADRLPLAPPPAPHAPTKEPTGTERQPTTAPTQPAAGFEQGNPQAIRLIARANLLLEQGNIGAARNMLDRAAEMGSMEALFWLAETYDPRLLSARQTYGTQSDIAKAREFYGKALAGGVDEAKARLEALQQ